MLRLVLTVIAAELSYRYVEVPIRNGAFARWRRRLARREGARRRAGPIVLASAAGLLLVAVNTVSASGSSSLDELTSQDDDLVAPATSSARGHGPAAARPSVAGAAAATHHRAGDDRPRRRRRPARSPCSPTRCCSAPRTRSSRSSGADGYIVDFRGRPALMLHQSNNDLEAAKTPVGETVVIGLGHNTLWERDRARFDTWAEKFDSEADELLATLRAARRQEDRLGHAARAVGVGHPAGGSPAVRAVRLVLPVRQRAPRRPRRPPSRRRPRRLGGRVQRGRADLRRDAPHVDGIRLMIDTIRTAGQI